jgi:carotenoid cleavage dioxygenase-like enzyme
MPVQQSDLLKAFSSQYLESSLDDLTVIGEVPDWLKGSFISIGPAQFEVGKTHFTHWFDGFSMLKKFTFNAGKVHFQNRFLCSEQYVKSNAEKKLYFDEFGTYARASWLGNLLHSLKFLVSKEQYDNCNVNTTKINNQLVAMTETSRILNFDRDDLNTLGDFKFTDNLRGQMSLAHPHLDAAAGEIINILTEVGSNIKYHIYKIARGSNERILIKTYTSDKLFYMHSFSLTYNYIVLFKSPLICDKFKLMFGMPFNKTLSWQENKGSSFIIINRRNGEVTEVDTDSFVCLHSVNAYEKNNELILDLICHENGNPYDTLYLKNLLSEQPIFHNPTLRRFIIDVPTKRCQMMTIANDIVEFPRINYLQRNGLAYNFAYTALMMNGEKSFLNAIQKINVNTGKAHYWCQPDYYVGEAIFVRKPNIAAEDDGIVLFITFNKIKQFSSLIILDAKTMHQLAEIFLPFHLPCGLHGNFY